MAVPKGKVLQTGYASTKPEDTTGIWAVVERLLTWASSSHPMTTVQRNSAQFLAAFSVMQALIPKQFFLQVLR